MNKKNTTQSSYWWIFIIVVIVIIILFILYHVYWEKNTWIGDLINIFCGLASIAGVVLALIQISNANTQIDTVSNIANATKEAVLDNKKEIRQFLSFSEMGHLIEVIKNTQNYILKKDYSSAVILMQNIKDDMLRADSQFASVQESLNIDLPSTIKKINIDINSLVNHTLQEQTQNNTSLKPKDIHANLEEAREIIIKIESNLKLQKV